RISTLQEIYLRGTQIGGNNIANRTLYEEAALALAQGISAQQNLRILDLSGCWLEDERNEGVISLFRSLPPSLTQLGIGFNGIGSYLNSFDVKALAQAVSKMSNLTSFKGYQNGLCYAPDVLEALQNKQKLTVLDLSHNDCTDTIQMRDLLQTTPNLEVLNLYGNQLTNGSILADTLSTLRKLKSLDLGGNEYFTTADCVSLWKATSSFLTKSPIPLDVDQKYTTEYLQSLNPTIASLNLSGLIQSHPAALETIMPQVVDLFPNLMALDLSNNDIFDLDDHRAPILGGIQALKTYLPRLTNLQSLSLSNAGTMYGDITPPTELITFPQIVGNLTKLQEVDFSGTQFFSAESLGKGLENIHSLTSINLDDCWWANYVGIIDIWQGGIQLIQGLRVQPHLKHLDLSRNSIGSFFLSNKKDPNSTLALAKALNSWPQLQSLNLAYNFLGEGDSASAFTFLENLGELAVTIHGQGRTLEVDFFSGISNFTWTQGAQTLAKLTQNKIKAACELEKCTGKPISTTPSEPQAQGTQRERSTPPTSTLPFATSDAIRSHNVPWYSPARLVATLRSIWQGSPQTVDTTNPQVEKLVRFQEKCDRLIAKADTQTADPWYRFSLEDLREDLAEMANNPTEVNEDTIKHLYRRLDGIEGDFLRKPLLKKPSFFAGSNQNIAPITDSNAVVELWTASMPLLGNSPVPLALGY
ncbi:MAG TPA: hypothetical protein VMW10_04625, partial [Alphaproteobacteria bacterium]|nr:hypothetical protein [Alphaproteobacteria bacterium]